MAKAKGDKPLIELGQVQKIPAVTRAARVYLQARADYADAGVTANDSKQRLVSLMQEHKLEGYVCDGREIIRSHKEALKVKEVGVASDEVDAEEPEAEMIAD